MGATKLVRPSLVVPWPIQDGMMIRWDVRCSQCFVVDMDCHRRFGDHCGGDSLRDDTIGGWRVTSWPFS